MKCNICGSEKINKVCSNKILNKYDIDYFQCEHCGYFFAEEAYWLNEAYEDSIASTDTGYMQRNIDFVIKTNAFLNKNFTNKSVYLDYGGGYGIFTRMMRDCGHNFLWTDKFSDNLLARGFSYDEQKIDLVTAFELFEHFQNPKEEFENLLKYSSNILLSTTLYDEEFQIPEKDWYYFTKETGQHISFYSKKTFEYLAEKYNVNYYMINDNIHLFTNKKINIKQLKFYFNNRFGLIYDYTKWIKNRKSIYCIEDKKYIEEQLMHK